MRLTKRPARILVWLAAAPIVVLVVLFAVSNLGRVTLHLWPLPYDMTISLWALTLIELFVGFLMGVIVTWVADRRRRRHTRTLARRVGELESALAAARRPTSQPEATAISATGSAPLPTSRR
jgi:uncharacterized integral membrane protein